MHHNVMQTDGERKSAALGRCRAFTIKLGGAGLQTSETFAFDEQVRSSGGTAARSGSPKEQSCMIKRPIFWPLAGAAAVIMSGAGGYLASQAAHAEPVNPPVARVAAPVPRSFADLVQQVAPAVVSIDIVGKSDDRRVAYRDAPPSAPFGSRQPGNGNDDDQSPPFGAVPQQTPRPRQDQPSEPMWASGSGFFISPDGYILTNNHVVENAQEITVRTKDDREMKARLVGRDPATDLAVIKVEGPQFPYVSFEDRALPRVGDWVVAVGNPFGLGGTATAGIVSALGRKNVSESSFVDYMQIDAPINHGNSGGPTFDVEGHVVGVNTAIFSPSGGSVGIGFDIPADVAASVSGQLIAHGRIIRGYIGARIQDVTAEIADSIGLKGRKGALVADVTDSGPAQKAGLRAGDVVLDVNGRDIASASDLTRQVALASPGQDIRLRIRRDGVIQALTVRSGQRPFEAELADNSSPDVNARPHVLGLLLAPDPSGGLKIKGVRDGSDAGVKGLHPGDIIRRAGDRAVASVSDLAATVDAARKARRKDVLLLVARDGHQLFVPLHVDQAAG
jgi:serine protease Do